MLKNNKCEYRNDEADKINLNKKVNLIDFNKINGMYYIRLILITFLIVLKYFYKRSCLLENIH